MRDWKRVVGTWQIVGGVVGAVTFLDRTPRAVAGRDARTTVLAVVVPLCALFALSGWALVRGNAPATARAWATALWLPQVVGFRAGAVAFRLALAPYVMANVVPEQGVGLTVALNPHLVFYTHSPGAESWWLTINLLALFALARLWLPASTAATTPESGPHPPSEVAVQRSAPADGRYSES